MVQQQMELEQLLQLAENLKNDIIKLHDQQQELIQRINLINKSQTSVLYNVYSFMSNKNLLLFGMKKLIEKIIYLFFLVLVSGFLTGFCVLPTISKICSSIRV
jgi:predicted PurR-regulated permease PerM